MIVLSNEFLLEQSKAVPLLDGALGNRLVCFVSLANEVELVVVSPMVVELAKKPR